MSQPIQPTLRRQLAQLLSTADPRCGFEEHNRVALGDQCPRCKMDLWQYLEVTPTDWPA